MSHDDQLKNVFNRLLVDYMNTFNYLELNVGLCVRRLSPQGLEETDKELVKMSFEKKLAYLLELVASHDGHDLHAWCKEAHSKRNERNMFMHGQWAFFPHLEQGVEFHIAPWVREKYADIYPGSRFSLEQLESIVFDIKSCFADLQTLRRKYAI